MLQNLRIYIPSALFNLRSIIGTRVKNVNLKQMLFGLFDNIPLVNGREIIAVHSKAACTLVLMPKMCNWRGTNLTMVPT